jgi:hypothetical protein
MSEDTHPVTQHHIPVDLNPQQHYCEILKSLSEVLNPDCSSRVKLLKYFCVIQLTRCTDFTNLFCHETTFSDSLSVHHQEFIHCTLSNGIYHTGL